VLVWFPLEKVSDYENLHISSLYKGP